MIKYLKYWLGLPAVVMIEGNYYVTVFSLDHFSRVYIYMVEGVAFLSTIKEPYYYHSLGSAMEALNNYKLQQKRKVKPKVTVV